MPSQKRRSTETIIISMLEKEFEGKQVKVEAFLKVFEPNGAGAKDYRHYFNTQEDENYFADAYMEQDPRLIDYTPEDGYSEEAAMRLDFPTLRLFAEPSGTMQETAVLRSFSVCKTYATGCMSPPASSTVLIKAEADRIRSFMATMMAKSPSRRRLGRLHG